MGVSIQKAARQLLKWNLMGLARGGIPRRGTYLVAASDPDKCFACKVGLVMLGRYGRERAMDQGGANENLMAKVKGYGPRLRCPVNDCQHDGYLDRWTETAHIGGMIEHLFECHKWSVMRIDKWLAEKGDTTVEEAQAALA